MEFKLSLLITFVLGLSACGMIQRHPDSGYAVSDDEKEALFNNDPSFTTGKFQKNRIETQPPRKPASLRPLTKDDVQLAIEAADILLGMNREEVKESWGRPARIEVSGNQKLGNERWTYKDYVSGNDGYQPLEKIVVFSNGRVSGWRTK